MGMDECKQSDILSLVADIENIETFKVIALIDNSEFLSDYVYEFETLEELQKNVKLEYGQRLCDIVGNSTKINWIEILWYFQLKQKKIV
jgi:hypothetical protein